MTKEDRKKQFLAKASEADEKAAKATDPKAREAWQAIAESYRALAKTTYRA